MSRADSFKIAHQAHLAKALREVKKVEIDQRSMVLLFLDLLKVFAKRLSDKCQLDLMYLTIICELEARCIHAKELAFKDIDGEVAKLLKNLLAALTVQTKSIEKSAVLMEQEFQETRSLESYHFVFERLFSPYISYLSCENRLNNCQEIWVPGCGKSNEIFWLSKRFPESRFLFIDNNPSETAATLQKRNELIQEKFSEHTALEERLQVECFDLSVGFGQSQVLSSRPCDVFFFFHPYLIENSAFSALQLRICQAKNMREQEELAMQTPLSPSAVTIVRNLMGALKDDGIGIFTFVEYSELLMFAHFAASEGISLSFYKNHFAIRKLNCYLMDLKVPRVLEPRSYHYVAFVSKNSHGIPF